MPNPKDLHQAFIAGVCSGAVDVPETIGCNPPNYDAPPSAEELERRRARMGDLSGSDPRANEAATAAFRAAREKRMLELEGQGSYGERMRAISTNIRQGR